MPWYTFDIHFHIEAATDEAAELLIDEVEEPFEDARLIVGVPTAKYALEDQEEDGDPDHMGFPIWLVHLAGFIQAKGANQVATIAQEILTSEGPSKYFKGIGEIKEVDRPVTTLPETQAALGEAAEWSRDYLRMELDDLRRGGNLSDCLHINSFLPAGSSSLYTPEFLEQFEMMFASVSEKLQHYPDTYLASTAEELTAHMLIGEARGVLEMWDESGDYDEKILSRANRQLEEIHELAFEDHDVLMLFEAELDGFEETEELAPLELTNLKAKDWFKPFRSE